MQEWDDMALLREYAERDSEAAFATLAARHVNKVYSVALRLTRNPGSAEEITQAVFVILAKKSRQLGKGVILSGWLYQTARLTAVTYVRGEIRRAHREQEAYMQTLANETGPEVWPQIAPLLDAAMAGLSETDRHAVVLRYFDGKSMKEVGTALGASEDSAKMRVSRAMEKLRRFFAKRGVTVSVLVLTTTLAAESVQAAPVTLAKAATTVAVVKGATASASTATLVKGALKLIAWTNVKTAVAIGVALLAAGTTATLVVQSQSQPGTVIPRSSWVSSGYGDPESTLKTLLGAMIRHDATNLFASMSPDCQKEIQELAAQAKPPMPVPQFLTEVWAMKVDELAEIRILKMEFVSEDQAILKVSGKREGKTADNEVALQKIGAEWKFDDFAAGSNVKGRSGMPLPNAEYGGIGVELQLDDKTHTVRIKSALPDSPAARAGLVPGQIISAINGVSTAKKSGAECVFLIRGLVGKTVRLELVDPEKNETNRVQLVRQKIKQ